MIENHMQSAKLIKRYANRRLYDAETSRTITLDDVAACVKSGRDVRVVDNITGEDITSQVLGQTFLKISSENENSELSTFMLTALIRDITNSPSNFFSKMIQGGIGSTGLTPDRIEKIARTMVESGQLEGTDVSHYVEEILYQMEINEERISEKIEKGLGVLRSELKNNSDSRKIEELSGKLDEMARIIHDMKK
ncbi:MAG: polyhydroxyalkanoate biosynthesis repressor PhaR [Spirochaetia bacterium]|nr:polyhydroxyalkanoate biosynthesis repressor PhaR [Spirochaetia bacterium]